MSADVSQLRALAAKQGKAAAMLETMAGAAVRKSGQDLVRAMQSEITRMDAVDTGDMLNSTAARQLDPLTVSVGPTVEYAGYVHDGTYRRPPRPFATNAAKIVGPNFEAAIRTVGEMLA